MPSLQSIVSAWTKINNDHIEYFSDGSATLSVGGAALRQPKGQSDASADLGEEVGGPGRGREWGMDDSKDGRPSTPPHSLPSIRPTSSLSTFSFATKPPPPMFPPVPKYSQWGGAGRALDANEGADSSHQLQNFSGCNTGAPHLQNHGKSDSVGLQLWSHENASSTGISLSNLSTISFGPAMDTPANSDSTPRAGPAHKSSINHHLNDRASSSAIGGGGATFTNSSGYFNNYHSRVAPPEAGANAILGRRSTFTGANAITVDAAPPPVNPNAEYYNLVTLDSSTTSSSSSQFNITPSNLLSHSPQLAKGNLPTFSQQQQPDFRNLAPSSSMMMMMVRQQQQQQHVSRYNQSRSREDMHSSSSSSSFSNVSSRKQRLKKSHSRTDLVREMAAKQRTATSVSLKPDDTDDTSVVLTLSQQQQRHRDISKLAREELIRRQRHSSIISTQDEKEQMTRLNRTHFDDQSSTFSDSFRQIVVPHPQQLVSYRDENVALSGIVASGPNDSYARVDWSDTTTPHTSHHLFSPVNDDQMRRQSKISSSGESSDTAITTNRDLMTAIDVLQIENRRQIQPSGGKTGIVSGIMNNYQMAQQPLYLSSVSAPSQPSWQQNQQQQPQPNQQWNRQQNQLPLQKEGEEGEEYWISRCAKLESALLSVQTDLDYLRTLELQREVSHNNGESRNNSRASAATTAPKLPPVDQKNARLNLGVFSSSSSLSQGRTPVMFLCDASKRLKDLSTRHKQQVKQSTHERAYWQNDMHLKLEKFAMMCKNLNEEAALRNNEVKETKALLDEMTNERNMLSSQVDSLTARVEVYERERAAQCRLQKEWEDEKSKLLDEIESAIKDRDEITKDLTRRLDLAVEIIERERKQYQMRRQIFFPGSRLQHPPNPTSKDCSASSTPHHSPHHSPHISPCPSLRRRTDTTEEDIILECIVEPTMISRKAHLSAAMGRGNALTSSDGGAKSDESREKSIEDPLHGSGGDSGHMVYVRHVSLSTSL